MFGEPDSKIDREIQTKNDINDNKDKDELKELNSPTEDSKTKVLQRLSSDERNKYSLVSQSNGIPFENDIYNLFKTKYVNNCIRIQDSNGLVMNSKV